MRLSSNEMDFTYRWMWSSMQMLHGQWIVDEAFRAVQFSAVTVDLIYTNICSPFNLTNAHTPCSRGLGKIKVLWGIRFLFKEYLNVWRIWKLAKGKHPRAIILQLLLSKEQIRFFYLAWTDCCAFGMFCKSECTSDWFPKRYIISFVYLLMVRLLFILYLEYLIFVEELNTFFNLYRCWQLCSSLSSCRCIFWRIERSSGFVLSCALFSLAPC